MIRCDDFFTCLSEEGIGFYVGVPDHLLKDFCFYLSDTLPSEKHVVAANEGNAIALAAGYHLASESQIALVYMQNSGLGNALNPMVSLVDPQVYSIPLLLLVGWRGEPGTKDEPQHLKQGGITLKLLDTMGTPYAILPASLDDARAAVQHAVWHIRATSSPYALVVRKGTFEVYSCRPPGVCRYTMTREHAIETIAMRLDDTAILAATTGMTSRELHDIRQRTSQRHDRDFLAVGSMGHCSQIALGIALSRPKVPVYCLDGDGALIMHMGGMAIIGSLAPKNFRHIVLNNGCHDSVGGVQSAGFRIDMPGMALACGYRFALYADSHESLLSAMDRLMTDEGPSLLEVRVASGARRDLGQPRTDPWERKEAFMTNLKTCDMKIQTSLLAKVKQ